VLLELLVASFGQLSLELLPFELPLPCDVLALDDGDAVCANACVMPTPPTTRPLASATATAALRTLLFIPITSFPRRPQHIAGT
jgi:hypothetical protein